MPPSPRRASRWPLWWVITRAVIPRAALCLALPAIVSACASESLPDDAESLTLRDYLGLAPAQLTKLTDAQRATLRQYVLDALEAPAAEEILDGAAQEGITSAPEGITAARVAAPLPVSVTLPPKLRAATPPDGLQQPLRFVRVFDQARAERSLSPVLLATLRAQDADAEVSPARITLDALGLTLAPSPSLRPLRTSGDDPARDLLPDTEEASAQRLYWDDTWPTTDEPALANRSQRVAVEALAPLLARVAGRLAPSGVRVQVVPAPRAPLLVWYVHAHRALLVNPALLYLLSEAQAEPDPAADPSTGAAQLVTRTQSLELDFIRACISDQRSRCAQCLESPVDEVAARCVPITLVSGEVPSQTAVAECERMLSVEDERYRPGELIQLQCYHDFAATHLTCLNDSGVIDRCGLQRVPMTGFDQLWMIKPFLNDERCQYALQSCEERAPTPVTPEPEPNPEPTPPQTPYFPPATSDDSASFASLACDACQLLAACSPDEDVDNGSAESGNGLCDGDSDSSSSSSSGSDSSSDSSLCSGDSTDDSDDDSSLCGSSDSDSDSESSSDDTESAALAPSSPRARSVSAKPPSPMRGHPGRDALLLLSFGWLAWAWWRDRRAVPALAASPQPAADDPQQPDD
jgi:hypothetical protein